MSAEVDSALVALRLAVAAGADRGTQTRVQRAMLAPELRDEFEQRLAEIAAQRPPCCA